MRPPHTASLLFTAWLAGVVPISTANAESAGTEDLRREVDALKKTLREMQNQLRRQDELIRRLSAERPAPPGAPSTPAVTTPPAPAVAAAPSPAPPPPTKEPWSPAQPITLLSGGRAYMNISFDSLVDFGWSTTSDVRALEFGDHDPNQRGFTIPNEEIVFDGAVDPYFKGVADIVFKLDQDNETEVELEEAYLTSTALPWNLQTKAGQYFTEFGRLNQQHPHAWDFVDQPLVEGRMFGPEGLRNPGARVSWLAPTPFYSELFLSMQDSQGTTAYSFRNSQDSLFGTTPLDRPVHDLGDLLYVPRYAASFDLTDSQTLVAGVSGAFGPNDSGKSARTQIYGGDLYWKWKPSWQSGGFPFVSWQTEAMGRRYQAGAGPLEDDASVPVPAGTFYDWGFYSQVLYGFKQRWVAGARVDWVTGQHGEMRPDNNPDRVRFSPDVTFYPTEFSKLRLQYNYDHGQTRGSDNSVWMQVEFLLGSHSAHKF
jgi:hypothetical protein